MPFSPFTGSRLSSIFGGGMPPQARTPPNPFTSPLSPSMPGMQPPPQASGPKRFVGNTPTASPNTNPEEPESQDMAGQNYFRLLQELSANRPKQTAYENAVSQTPRMQDYQPSKMRRLGAALAGIGGGLQGGAATGIASAENLLYSPYRNALQDYQTRIGGLKAEAESEMGRTTEYRENLKTAATLGLTEDKQGSENFYKGVAADIASRKAGTDQFQAETQRQQAVNQVTRWQSQSKNEADRNALERLKAGIQAGNVASLAEYRRRMATSAETNAAANTTRANKYEPGGGSTRLPDVEAQQDARNLVLEQMRAEGKQGITVNQGAYGPTYEIDPKYMDKKLDLEIKRRIVETLKQSYPKYGGEINLPETGDSDFDIGPLQF
jgi:hypothetical protein